MNIPIDLYGASALVLFIVISQLYITYRAISCAKSQILYLRIMLNDAIQEERCTVHYQRAHDILEELNTQIIISTKKSFWGRWLNVLLPKVYEIPDKR